MLVAFASRGMSVGIAGTIPNAWSLARNVCKAMPVLREVSPEIALVQRFLAEEDGPDFELISMLAAGVGVHHAGMPDEARSLIEWLAELGHLKVLCATTTIAQGINFPVSSVFLSTTKYPYGQEMPTREFWNLAGRAGRIGQEAIGVVGIAENNRRSDLTRYVSTAHDLSLIHI